jgi:hypothetical protein
VRWSVVMVLPPGRRLVAPGTTQRLRETIV